MLFKLQNIHKCNYLFIQAYTNVCLFTLIYLFICLFVCLLFIHSFIHLFIMHTEIIFKGNYTNVSPIVFSHLCYLPKSIPVYIYSPNIQQLPHITYCLHSSPPYAISTALHFTTHHILPALHPTLCNKHGTAFHNTSHTACTPPHPMQ